MPSIKVTEVRAADQRLHRAPNRADPPRPPAASPPPDLHAGPGPLDAHIGKRIRSRREALVLSQERLAAALGLGIVEIEHYEQGTGRVSAAKLFNLAQALAVDIAYFYEDFSARGGRWSGYRAASFIPAAEARREVEELLEQILYGMLERRETIELIRLYGRVRSPLTRRKICELIETMGKTE